VKRFKAILAAAENYSGYVKYNLKELTKKDALKNTDTGKSREHFYNEDLVMILSELRRRKTKGEFTKNPHLLLIPLIALFQGMRQNEICQLRVADILQVDGLWCISVNEDLDADGTKSGKKVKSKNSFRTMPVHPALEELGLIRFWEKQRNKKRVRLWEGEGKVSCALGTDGKHNKLYGQWFLRSVRDKVKLDYSRRDKQCFHSFRHTFVDWFDKNLHQDHDRHAVVVLTGHLYEKSPDKSLSNVNICFEFQSTSALNSPST
jgi:integrase